MKKLGIIGVITVLLLSGCATNSYAMKTALAGAGVGAGMGAAMADSEYDDTGRMILGSALIGGVIGFVIGGVIDLSQMSKNTD